MDEAHGVDAATLAAAFVCGALVGAAIATLYAPADGRQTRAWIATSSRATRDRAARLFERNQQLIAIVRREGIRGLLRRQEARTSG
jgi:gas vesicle protein